MTIANYSIDGLKDLLEDLKRLSTCIMNLPLERIDSSAHTQLLEDQYNLIVAVSDYGSMLQDQGKDSDHLRAV